MEIMLKYLIIPFIFFIIIFGGVWFIIDTYKNINNPINIDTIQIQDTTYTRIELDSIIYNIVKRDSIIYTIKQKNKEDENEIISLDDSATIELFYSLIESRNSK